MKNDARDLIIQNKMKKIKKKIGKIYNSMYTKYSVKYQVIQLM